jgi:epoxyqueuosine reductase
LPANGSWTSAVEGLAREVGLDLVGIVPLEPAGTFRRYEEWLAAGYHGEMGYLARTDAVERRRDPARILPGARTAVVAGLNYHTLALPPGLRDDPARGLVASYAWGVDYHDVMLPRLERLAASIAAAAGRPVPYRA